MNTNNHKIYSILFCLAFCLACHGENAKPATNQIPAVDGPPTVTVTCGDVLVRIDGPKLWTMSRIEYMGTVLGIEKSAYGTVFNFPNVGFIGTAHKENEVEQVKHLEFYLDGSESKSPPTNITGSNFKLVRASQIRDFALECTLELKKNRIYEQVVMKAQKAVPLAFVYHFMHAWTPTATDYISGRDGGEEVRGELKDNKEVLRAFYITNDMDWMAVYDRPSGKGAVSRLVEKPARGGAEMRLWNAPPSYRKFYLKCFTDQTVPEGFVGTYRMTTGFFAAKENDWAEAARRCASELKEDKSSANRRRPPVNN